MEHFFDSVQNCWSSSVLHQFSDVVSKAPYINHDWLLFCTDLVLLFVGIIFFRYIITASSLSFSVFFKKMNLNRNQENQFTVFAVNLVAIMAVVVVVNTLAIANITNLSIFHLFMAICAVIISRWLLSMFFRLLRGNAEMWNKVWTLSKLGLIVSAVLLMPVLLSAVFVHKETVKYLTYYCFVVYGLVYFIYLIKTSKIILSSKCSLFFWFLYLCAHEFLPIGLFISAFVRI